MATVSRSRSPSLASSTLAAVAARAAQPAAPVPVSLLTRKLDALVASKTVPKAMTDLLSLVVAHCNDNDGFKRRSAARLEAVEGVVALPTDEIDSARLETLNQLRAVQRQTANLEETLLRTREAAKAEHEQMEATIAISLERTKAEYRRLDDEAEAFLSKRAASFTAEMERAKVTAISGYAMALKNAREEAGEVLEQEVRSSTAAAHRSLEDTIGGWKEEAANAIREAATHLRGAAADAIRDIDRRADHAVTAVASAAATLGTLPLVEAHHAQASLAVLEAQVSILRDGSASRTDLAAVRTRLEALENELAFDPAALGVGVLPADTTEDGESAIGGDGGEGFEGYLNQQPSGATPPPASASATATATPPPMAMPSPGGSRRRERDALRNVLVPGSASPAPRSARPSHHQQAANAAASATVALSEASALKASVMTAQSTIAAIETRLDGITNDILGLTNVFDHALVDKLAPLGDQQRRLLQLFGVDEGWLLHYYPKARPEERTGYLIDTPWVQRLMQEIGLSTMSPTRPRVASASFDEPPRTSRGSPKGAAATASPPRGRSGAAAPSASSASLRELASGRDTLVSPDGRTPPASSRPISLKERQASPPQQGTRPTTTLSPAGSPPSSTSKVFWSSFNTGPEEYGSAKKAKGRGASPRKNSPVRLTHEKVRGVSASLGVDIAPNESATKRGIREAGVRVTRSWTGGAAHTAGIRDGDVVLRVDDIPVEGVDSIERLLTNVKKSATAGRPVITTLHILRAHAAKSFDAEVRVTA